MTGFEKAPVPPVIRQHDITSEEKMSQGNQNPPSSIHARVASGITIEGGPIDYQLLVDGAQAIVQAHFAAEDCTLRKLASETALLLGPHVRINSTTSAWETYKNETH